MPPYIALLNCAVSPADAIIVLPVISGNTKLGPTTKFELVPFMAIFAIVPLCALVVELFIVVIDVLFAPATPSLKLYNAVKFVSLPINSLFILERISSKVSAAFQILNSSKLPLKN